MRLKSKARRVAHRVAALNEEAVRLSIICHEQGYENACLRARVAELEAALTKLQTSFETECTDTDLLLKHLGLDPADCRTDSGWLRLTKIKLLLERKP